MKVHFFNQARKLNTDQNRHGRHFSPDKISRHLDMLMATHRVYEYFTVVQKPQLLTFESFLQDLGRYTHSPANDAAPEPETDSLISNEQAAYLKVLTQSPFTQYEPLRTNVFRWVLYLLTDFQKEVKIQIKAGKFTYATFKDLKFLIRRAGLLNSNYLFSKQFFGFLIELYKKDGIPKLIEFYTVNSTGLLAERHLEIKNRLEEFYVFYAAQIKELLLKNESRCIRLEHNLKVLDKCDDLHIRQIVRVLREESGLTIHAFYENISQDNGWMSIYHKRGKKSLEKEPIIYPNKPIADFLKKTSISYHQKYLSLNNYFSAIGRVPIERNNSLLNYLWLRYFFANDRFNQIDLDDKTDFIMSKLKNILLDHQISVSGSFLIVYDSKNDPFFAYDKNAQGTREIDSTKWGTSDMLFLQEFLNGKQANGASSLKEFKTIIELGRDGDGNWNDLYTPEGLKPISTLSPNVVSKSYQRLMLVRLSKRSYTKRSEKPQAIIGFYYTTDKPLSAAEVDVARYMILLRESFSQFIQNHHESDEFRKWQLAEIKQKMSILSGHGKEMLLNIALREDNHYKEIAYTLLKVQRLLIDKKEEFREANRIGIASSRINRIFKSFFKAKPSALNTSYFKKDLVEMATDIFGFQEIENKETLSAEDVQVTLDPESIDFQFDKDLLNMFCFEILVNAKKNRWLFLDDMPHEGYEESFTTNRIWITVKKTVQMLELSIGNTGPRLKSGELQKIQEKKNIKRYDYSSGIEMINTVLTEFEIGSMSFEEDYLSAELSRFTVKLVLYTEP
ncbi:hypothetical protein GWR56_13590 [Mucilaginibacter sp. 14171R-50]|uniref:hypothetical protein n=1 Tax=Mucilaginibacter sp. 14171R-50 TaxID=2703789 RepID=UPI00138B7234|nr:hypothetical protein [Mucilaginibacter sp. 14171R-50]QHS56521.1 hypothetical protein GWR56_13590 [Mucilaginibacter sp. 14171R-50]